MTDRQLNWLSDSEKAKDTAAVLYSDGASKGNPGPAGIGAVLIDGAGETVAEIAEWIGRATNNVAEYKAMIAGLERAKQLGYSVLTVRADSELVVRQVNGVYKVKHPDMIPLFLKIKELVKGFRRVTFEHIPREKNRRADELANQGIAAAR